MPDMRKVAVIIPAFDESMTIRTVVEGVRRQGCDVFVVDDASRDDTRDQALKAGAEVLSLPFSAGAWCAVQAGLLHAMKKGRYDAYLTMDGDDQHDPAGIPLMKDALDDSGANVVIGSFPQRGSLARRIVWRFFSLMTRLKVRDITSGLRLYDPQAAAALLSRHSALFDYQDLGVLLMLRRKGLSFREVPVTMRPRRSGCSHVFHSWSAVTVYMAKTCVLILSDWIAAPGGEVGDWRDYDVV